MAQEPERIHSAAGRTGAQRACRRPGGRYLYELFCTAREAGTSFLVRTCVDRLAGDGKQTVSAQMKRVAVKGLYRIEVKDRKGMSSHAVLEIKYRRIRVLPPVGKQKQYPELDLTVIYAQERGTSHGREKIDWKLITSLPVSSRSEAVKMLTWYAARWKIEMFHKILNSGCRAEESKLRIAERIVNLIAVFRILSWRVFWMTMLNRCVPDGTPLLALNQLEIYLLDSLMPDKDDEPRHQRPLST